MALNINIKEKTEDITHFRDIRKGDFFICNGTLFLKLEEIFIADEIIHELEFEHDFEYEEDINSDRYNCLLVGSECDYRNFGDNTVVERIDIDVNVRYVI